MIHAGPKFAQLRPPGVNTGFGAWANTRTVEIEALQRVLTRELSYGVLTAGPRDPRGSHQAADSPRTGFDPATKDTLESDHLPKTWVRAAIVVRMNFLVKGRSGVRPVIVERLRDLLEHDIVPPIPLRGSISASGNLNPLAYIASVMQGKTTVRVLPKPGRTGHVYADEALAQAEWSPIHLMAKVGLAIQWNHNIHRV